MSRVRPGRAGQLPFVSEAQTVRWRGLLSLVCAWPEADQARVCCALLASSLAESAGVGASSRWACGPASAGAPSAGGDPQADLDAALSDAKTAMDDANKAMQSGDWTAYGDAQTRLNNALNRAVSAQERMGG